MEGAPWPSSWYNLRQQLWMAIYVCLCQCVYVKLCYVCDGFILKIDAFLNHLCSNSFCAALLSLWQCGDWLSSYLSLYLWVPLLFSLWLFVLSGWLPVFAYESASGICVGICVCHRVCVCVIMFVCRWVYIKENVYLFACTGNGYMPVCEWCFASFWCLYILRI